jgi:hypothetical protein
MMFMSHTRFCGRSSVNGNYDHVPLFPNCFYRSECKAEYRRLA